MRTNRLAIAILGGIVLLLVGVAVGVLISQPAKGGRWCVVTEESEPFRRKPAGSLVRESDPGSGCDPGEYEVCGLFRGEADDRIFDPRACSDR